MLESDFIRVIPPRLQPWVAEVWYSRGTLELSRERVLPSLTTDIVANLGETMELVQGEGDREITGTTVTGLLTNPLVLEHPHVHEAVGVRLSFHGLRAVLGVPAAAAHNAVIPVHEYLPDRTDQLRDVCARAATPLQKVDAAVRWLAGRIAEFASEVDPLVAWATNTIVAQHGTVSVHELQRQSGYGATRFNQRFTDEMGVTPKQFARLARFHRALTLLAPTRSVADVAVHCGYTDQAHMYRDFRLFAEATPTAVIEGRYSGGLTVAEG